MRPYKYTNIVQQISSLENQVNKIGEQYHYHNNENPYYCQSILNLLKLTQNIKQDLLENSQKYDLYNKKTSALYNKVCILESELNSLACSVRPIRDLNQQTYDPKDYRHSSESYSNHDDLKRFPNYHMRRFRTEIREPLVKYSNKKYEHSGRYFRKAPATYYSNRTSSSDSEEEVFYYWYSTPSESPESSFSDEEDMPVSTKNSQPSLLKKRKPSKKGVKEKRYRPRSSSSKFNIYKSNSNIKNTSSLNVGDLESEVFLIKKKPQPKKKVRHNKTTNKDKYFVSRLRKVSSTSSTKNNDKTEENIQKSYKKSIKNNREKNNQRGKIRSKSSFGLFKREKDSSRGSKTSFDIHNTRKRRSKLKPKRKIKDSDVVLYAYTSDKRGVASAFLNENLHTYNEDNITDCLSKESSVVSDCPQQNSPRGRGGSESLNKSKYFMKTDSLDSQIKNKVNNSYSKKPNNSTENNINGHAYEYFPSDTNIIQKHHISKSSKVVNKSSVINSEKISQQLYSELLKNQIYLIKIEDRPVQTLIENKSASNNKQRIVNEKKRSIKRDSGRSFYTDQNKKHSGKRPTDSVIDHNFNNSQKLCSVIKLSHQEENSSPLKSSIKSEAMSIETKVPDLHYQVSPLKSSIKSEAMTIETKVPDLHYQVIPKSTLKPKPNQIYNIESVNKTKTTDFIPTTYLKESEKSNIFNGERVFNPVMENTNLRNRSFYTILPVIKSESKLFVALANNTHSQPKIQKSKSNIKRFFSRSPSKASGGPKEHKKLSKLTSKESNFKQPEIKRSGSKIKRLLSGTHSKVSVSPKITRKESMPERQTSKEAPKKTTSFGKLKQALTRGTSKSKKNKKDTSDDVSFENEKPSKEKKNILKKIFSRHKQKTQKAKKSNGSDDSYALKGPRSVSGYIDDSSHSLMSQSIDRDIDYEQDRNYGITNKSHLSLATKQEVPPQVLSGFKNKPTDLSQRHKLNYSLHYVKETCKCVELDSIPSTLTVADLSSPNCRALWSKGEVFFSEHTFNGEEKHNRLHKFFNNSKSPFDNNKTILNEHYCKVCHENPKLNDVSNNHSNVNPKGFVRKVPTTESEPILSDCSSSIDWANIASKIKDWC